MTKKKDQSYVVQGLRKRKTKRGAKTYTIRKGETLTVKAKFKSKSTRIPKTLKGGYKLTPDGTMIHWHAKGGPKLKLRYVKAGRVVRPPKNVQKKKKKRK